MSHDTGLSSTVISKRLRISRQMTHRHLRDLLHEGLIYRTGSTRNSTYFRGKNQSFTNPLKIVRDLSGLQEDEVFAEAAARLNFKSTLNKNGWNIAYYAFTEMLNNAIDHSASQKTNISIGIEKGDFVFTVRDFGIGIFNRLIQYFNLKTEYEAIEYLFKGKQTSLPDHHSGQGIFFTSRIADSYSIRSNDLYVLIDNKKKDQIIKQIPKIKGTEVSFKIKAKSKKDLALLFKTYSNDDFEFDKNTVRIKLNSASDFISRSQAKKLLIGMEKFNQVIFDFHRINGIGQAFADEIFRVYPKIHPHIKIDFINASKPVEYMIKRALSSA